MELQGCAQAHVLDAVAIVKFLRWLENAVAQEEHVTEVSVSERLLQFRGASASFVSPSFATIAGFASNGAIIHYHPEEGRNNRRIDASDMFLLDSGGQYLNGTTDVTRTLHFGAASSHHKRCYTRVLQAHLQLQSMVFPKGITGYQLDVIARLPLWKDGMEYAHGTGHGVGHYLCVHEGPHGISHVQRVPDVALQAGDDGEGGGGGGGNGCYHVYDHDDTGAKLQHLRRNYCAVNQRQHNPSAVQACSSLWSPVITSPVHSAFASRM